MHITDLTPLRNWNTSKVTDMERLFQGNVDLESLNGLENWNTSNVTTMRGMFLASDQVEMHIKSLIPLRNWNTSKVTDMGGMFQNNTGLTSLEGIENWDVSNVTTMRIMFGSGYGLTMNIRSIEALRNWNTSSLKEMKSFLQLNANLESLNGIENWNTSKVEDFGWAFYGCSGLKEVNMSNLDLTKVKYYPGRVDIGGYPRESGADMFSSEVSNLERYITPKSYPSDSKVYINLPKKMYDSNGNEYKKLDNTAPTNTVLTSTRP